MLTDFKYWYIKQDDDGTVLEAAVRFYEGDITTENETDRDGNVVAVTRYRRTAKLDPKLETHIADKRAFKKDSQNNDVALYYPSDFGKIKTIDELNEFMKGELVKDKKRSPIDEQTKR